MIKETSWKSPWFRYIFLDKSELVTSPIIGYHKEWNDYAVSISAYSLLPASVEDMRLLLYTLARYLGLPVTSTAPFKLL